MTKIANYNLRVVTDGCLELRCRQRKTQPAKAQLFIAIKLKVVYYSQRIA